MLGSVTLWITAEEKLRLEDQAIRLCCSPSDLVQRMLAQWHGETQAVTAPVTDTEQLRALVQQELAKAQTVIHSLVQTKDWGGIYEMDI